MTIEEFIDKCNPDCDGDCCDIVECARHQSDARAALAELATLRAKLAMYQGLAHSDMLSTRGYCNTCERGYDMREGCPAPCPFCEADALREQVKAARLEGAREAFDMAQQSAEVVVVNGCPYVDMLEARSRYLATFGEVAP